MNSAVLADVAFADDVMDPIEEIRLRVWARKNYIPLDERDETWHPIILDEMLRKDLDD